MSLQDFVGWLLQMFHAIIRETTLFLQRMFYNTEEKSESNTSVLMLNRYDSIPRYQKSFLTS